MVTLGPKPRPTGVPTQKSWLFSDQLTDDLLRWDPPQGGAKLSHQ
jgi:hypothetical protein